MNIISSNLEISLKIKNNNKREKGADIIGYFRQH